jgi:hypothetical protein
MKEKIQAFLCVNNNWKKFIEAEPRERKEARILSIDVTTFLHEAEQVHFDVSLVYTVNAMGQKQSYKSGIGLLDKKGNIKKVSNHIP